MSPQFDEVLLTAYLDNEVTDEERARVEVELQKSETSRKLLEELRSVRDLVVQLHISQPTRRFEQGPWNATALPEVNAAPSPIDAPKVVLNEARWYRKIPFQRLASIAALIAIAVCASVLLKAPSNKSISRSEGAKTDKSVDAKSLEKFGNDVQSEFKELEDLIGQKNKEARGAGAMLHSPSLSKPKPSGQSFELGNDLAVADSRTDFSLQIVEDIEQLDRSKMRENNEFSKRVFFRYGVNKIEQQETRALAKKTDAPRNEQQLQESNSTVLDKRQSIEDNGINMGATLVEFQVPAENWELGAERLRKMGMDIPEKLPTVEFLEFTVIQNESTADSPIDQFVIDVKAANDTVASNWRFLVVAPLEKAKNREDATPAKVPVGKNENDKQNRVRFPAIQIRVRPIK